jgi:hypothetical protein
VYLSEFDEQSQGDCTLLEGGTIQQLGQTPVLVNLCTLNADVQVWRLTDVIEAFLCEFVRLDQAEQLELHQGHLCEKWKER